MPAPEVRFDPSLVEEAVFLVGNRLTASGDGHALAAFHTEREAAYALDEAAQREAAFQRLAHRAFHQLGLAALFTERLEEFPSLSEHVELIVVRRVWSRKDEQVELYVGRSPHGTPSPEVSTTVFIGLQARRCLDREALVAWLRHELMHVADMLDPAFAYDPHPEIGGTCEPEHERIRARFRALWDLWVYARIRRRGWHTTLDDNARQQDVMRAFAFLNPSAQAELITAVSGQSRFTQGELLALARGAYAEAA